MPLNEIPKHFDPEIRSLVEAALEGGWQELSNDVRKDTRIDVTPARSELIVAHAAVGETDLRMLTWFAIHAWRGAMQTERSAIAQCTRISGTAATGDALILPAATRAWPRGVLVR
jgi:hypothetical protein